eukprot:m.233603 g.233603  ORF g.233603 m.233603 type:complete len:493 (+) comp16027_c2_seq19:547-2025(+)
MEVGEDKRWYYVIPAVLLLSMVLSELRVASQELLFDLVCQDAAAAHNKSEPQFFGPDGFDCHTNTIKQEVAQWIQYTQLAFGCSCVLTVSGYGVISDGFGRKSVMLISLFGNFLVLMANTVTSAVYFPQWPWVLIAVNMIGGLCGGSGATLMAVFAYVADTVEEKKRATAFTVIEASYGAGSFVMLLVSGYISELKGLLSTFIVLSSIAAGTLVYILCLKESTSHTHESKKPSARNMHCLSSGLEFLWRAKRGEPRSYGSMVSLIVTFSTTYLAFMGIYSAAIVVFETHPYDWGDRKIGIYSASGAAGRTFAMVVAQALLHSRSEKTKRRMMQGFFALFSFATVAVTFTTYLPLICALNVVAGLSSTVAVGTLRSFFSAGNPACMQGQVLAMLAVIESVVNVVSPFVFNKILDSAPGIGVLWAVAILNFLCCFTLLGVGPLKAESEMTPSTDSNLPTTSSNRSTIQNIISIFRLRKSDDEREPLLQHPISIN